MGHPPTLFMVDQRQRDQAVLQDQVSNLTVILHQLLLLQGVYHDIVCYNPGVKVTSTRIILCAYYSSIFSILLVTYYSQNYASIVYQGLARGKVIGLSVVVTKVARSQGLGICERFISTTNPSKNWHQYASNRLAWPRASQVVHFCWPRLSTVPTAGHVFSAHMHNWPLISG